MQEHAFGNQDMTGQVHMRRGFIILTGLLILLLAGCRGGVLVFKGTHESQDEALLSRLGEKYPKMAFTCTGRTDILLYFHGGFTWGGEEHSGTFNLSLREGDSWGHDYPFDDYVSYLEEYVEKIDREPDID